MYRSQARWISGLDPTASCDEFGEIAAVTSKVEEMEALSQAKFVITTDDIKAITSYAMGWNQFMDLTISPVVDDTTGREIGKALPADEEI